jgi:putative NADPH-quinone reductase
MNCLLVVTHPLDDSLCKSLSKHVENRLIQNGHDVVVEDLYTDGFDPALTIKERESYYKGSYDSSEIEEQTNRLLNSEVLVLVFPTWWFGFPAMLKGWSHRVWGPGIAYDHPDDFGPIRPRLNRLNKVLVVTTMGSPWWVDRLVMWQPVRRVLKLALLGACTKGSKLQFLTLYNSEKLDEQKVAAFQNRIDKALDNWVD